MERTETERVTYPWPPFLLWPQLPSESQVKAFQANPTSQVGQPLGSRHQHLAAALGLEGLAYPYHPQQHCIWTPKGWPAHTKTGDLAVQGFRIKGF